VAWQIASRQKVLEWLAQEPDALRREAFLAWLPVLAEDPRRDALPVPNRPPIVFVREVLRANLAVTVLIAEQYRAIQLISIDDL